MLRRASLLLVMAFCSLIMLQAQPVLTPQNVALGGGGSTYITDYSANFYNPANLFISDRVRNIDVGLFISGTYFNGVQNFTNLSSQRGNLEDYIRSFTPGTYDISALERADIIDDNFIRDRTTSRHQTRLDVTLLGLKIRNSRRAFSFVVRNRISSSFEVGRGWYDLETQRKDNQDIIDRTLTHRYQSLYEISFGYAESFRFFTDMTPRLDEFTIGIAPKLVLGGPYQTADWENYYQENQNGSFTQFQQFDFEASGTIGKAARDYTNNIPAQQALTNHVADELFSIEGIGAGIDIGFTYLITLGNDLSTIANTDQRTQKSLRLSFSITDIGFVNYDSAIKKAAIPTDTTRNLSAPNLIANNAFIGAPGQFIDFTDQFSERNPLKQTRLREGGTTVLLPTALHGGILLEINRLKLMGDLSVGLSNNAFNSTKLVASVGIEIRPLTFLPLRAGTQLATELPNFFSFGTGIETKFWDLSIATQFVSRTFSDNPTLSGVTVAALQFHF